MQPKISIIVPVYNVEEYLPKALDSLINQTLKEIEIICINDCSPDNSAKILNEYASKDKRFIIINQAFNIGQGAARNIGIDMATGKYIMFLDPDDWYELDACEMVYNAAEKYSANVVYFPQIMISTTRNRKYISDLVQDFCKKSVVKIEPFTFFSILKIPNATFQTFGLGPCSFLCLSDFIKSNNIYFSPFKKAEDHAFVINLKILTPYLYTDKPLYNRLERENSSRIYETLYEEIIDSVKNVIEKYPNNKKIKDLFDDYAASRYMLKFKDNYQLNILKFICNHKNSMNIHQWTIFFCKYFVKYLFKFVFNIRNEFHNNIKTKVITILGIKLKIKIKQKQ